MSKAELWGICRTCGTSQKLDSRDHVDAFLAEHRAHRGASFYGAPRDGTKIIGPPKALTLSEYAAYKRAVTVRPEEEDTLDSEE